MEAAICNICDQASPLLVSVTGSLGKRFVQISEVYGLTPTVIEPPYGSGLVPGVLDAHLTQMPAGTIVLLQHCDTSTGVLTDLAAVAAVCKRHDAILVVDAIASAGAQPIGASRLGIDVVLGTSQKGLGAVPGLAFAVVSQRALEMAQRASLPRFSLDWRRLLQEQGPRGVSGGFTPPVNVVAALVAALREAERTGFERRWDLQRRLGQTTYQALRELGLRPVATPAAASPVITAVEAPSASAAILDEGFAAIRTEVPPITHGILRIAHFLEQGDLLIPVLNMLADRFSASPSALAGIRDAAKTVAETRTATPHPTESL